MRRRRHNPVRAAVFHALGRGSHALRQMHAVGPDMSGERRIGANQQDPVSPGAELFEILSRFGPVFCTKMAKNDPQMAVCPAWKARQRRNRVRDATGICQKQQGRKGFALTFPAASGF